MPLPGFTANASIGPTTQVYRVHDRQGTITAPGMYPQWNGEQLDHDVEQGLDDDADVEMVDQAIEGDTNIGEDDVSVDLGEDDVSVD